MRNRYLLAVLALSFALPAQSDLEKKLEEKLASEFLTKAPWITDYDQARAVAREKKLPIFAYFSRSYAP